MDACVKKTGPGSPQETALNNVIEVDSLEVERSVYYEPYTIFNGVNIVQ